MGVTTNYIRQKGTLSISNRQQSIDNLTNSGSSKKLQLKVGHYTGKQVRFSVLPLWREMGDGERRDAVKSCKKSRRV